MVSKSEDAFWDDVSACVNTQMADSLRRDDRKDDRTDDRKDDRRDGDSRDGVRDRHNNGRDKQDKHDKQDNGRNGQRHDKSKKCLFCGFNRHEVNDCRRMKAAAVIQQQELQNRDQNRDRNRRPAGESTPASASSRAPVFCYNCNNPGHISTNCPEPRRLTSSGGVNFIATVPTPLFLSIPAGARVDEHSTIVDDSGRVMDLPLYHALTQVREKREVFSLPPSSDLSDPTSVLHSFTQTRGGQDMLTVWDTGALLSLVPMSTVKALNLAFVPGSDVAFVVANGSRMEPLSYCPSMPFFVSSHPYVDKVYVVDTAPFQLLLGVQFLHCHWAGLFLPWGTVTLCRPQRIEVQCSVQKPQQWQHLKSEVVDDLDDIPHRVVA